MLAYAAQMPRPAGRAGSPKALTLVVAGHVAVLAAVLMAKPELIIPPRQAPTVVVDFHDPPKPEPQLVDRNDPQTPIQDSSIDQERPIIDMERQNPIEIATGPSIEDIETVIGSGPTTVLDPPHVPVRIGARLATSDDALKPPYPADKIRLEQEATLKLRLTIDARGRVTAVEPVGAADPSFLAAARKHILRSWRYKPATEDGVAMPTTTVISLSFRLEDV